MNTMLKTMVSMAALVVDGRVWVEGGISPEKDRVTFHIFCGLQLRDERRI